jgi:UDP-N-acetylmuramate--alanine ligase
MPQIIVVYQPHQNLRQHDKTIQHGYQNCFDLADKVYWLPTFLSRENPVLPVLTPNDLIKFCKKPEKFEVAEKDHILVLTIKKYQEQGDVVIFMGAGDIDNWAREQFSN